MTTEVKIGIVGTGNVANQLIPALQKVGITQLLAFGRNKQKSAELAAKFNIKTACSFEEFLGSDLIICCTSDDSLPVLMPELAQFAPTVTTSGTFDIGQVTHRMPIGVFYPLQTFTAQHNVDFSTIPLFVESTDSALIQLLSKIGSLLGTKAVEMSANERQYLHIAAVMINNFTNHIIDLTQEFAREHQLQFEWLLPLLTETIEKVKIESAFNNQTGPAKRNDKQTIEKQLSLLPDELKDLYLLLTNSIIKRHQNK